MFDCDDQTWAIISSAPYNLSGCQTRFASGFISKLCIHNSGGNPNKLAAINIANNYLDEHRMVGLLKNPACFIYMVCDLFTCLFKRDACQTEQEGRGKGRKAPGCMRTCMHTPPSLHCTVLWGGTMVKQVIKQPWTSWWTFSQLKHHIVFQWESNG